jgi:serine/threonine protein kinase
MITLENVKNCVSAGYVVESFLKGGGQGAVFKGSFQGTPVAIKLYNLQVMDDSRRVIREVELLKNIHHKNIVKVLHYEEKVLLTIPVLVVAYEYIENGDLCQFLTPEAPILTEDQIIDIGFQVASGIELLWAGEKRVVHRDIKPANIMSGVDRYVLVDYGLARHIDMSDITVIGACGTMGYMSPEQALGRKALTYKSDVFSLGVTLFGLASKAHPFNGRQPNLTSVPNNLSALRNDLSNDLTKLITDMMNSEASMRPSKLSDKFQSIRR